MNAQALIPVFYVADVVNAVDFHTRVLGFKQALRSGTYVGLGLGDLEMHITDPGEPRQIIGAGSAYVVCARVDRYFEQIALSGATAKSAPEDRAYGIRDFAVLDPDENQHTFGCCRESSS
jgi:catechol 2,3-dioxygenase-like lactoylglutathione lyase family enzyme